eukprot:2484063-Prymnesium_polylepis.1
MHALGMYPRGHPTCILSELYPGTCQSQLHVLGDLGSREGPVRVAANLAPCPRRSASASSRAAGTATWTRRRRMASVGH